MNIRMTTRFLVMVLLACFFLPATAKVIDQITAEKAARNFLFEKLNQKNKTAYNDVIVSWTYTVKENGVPVYYGINFRDGGFVIITADDNVKPIVGYSPDGFFKMDDQPENFKAWINGVKDQVIAIRSGGVQANEQISSQWTRLTDNSFAQKNVEKSSKNLDPLIMSHWDQGKFFNTLCPVDGAGPEGHALTGCVATAMAQVINYYRFPTMGTGTHTYNTNINPAPPYGHYGVLSVNYGAATYDFDGMVNDPTEANLEIAKLIYHCGVSLNMSYGSAGSGTQTQKVVGAITSHYHYSGTATYVQRSNYSKSLWYGFLLTDLDAKRPVLYSGDDPAAAAGHCFIADGYQINSTDTLIHFNWGWGGSNDGFYSIDDLNPGNQGPFNGSQAMVKGIYPASSFPYQCTGQKVITACQGTIEDGSSKTENYTDNADCSWLLAPSDSVKKFILTFNRFATESVNDVVKVYDGADTTAPLLYTHSGNSLPVDPIISTSNRMLITFHTNGTVNDEGWLASFKPIYPTYCTGTTLTAPSGTVSDGSSNRNYNSNSNCNWIIQPPNPDNKQLILEFTSFETELNNDFVKVYDLVTQTQIGATLSGNTLPPILVSNSGQIYIEFKTNYVHNYAGWSANYALGYIGIDEMNGFREMKIYPNPANDHLNINFNMDATGSLTLDLLSLTGQSLIKETYTNFSGIYNKSLDLSSIARGVYALRITSDKGIFTQKVVVQ